jgi:beta-lactam-binding protein with PASTA domain
MTLRTRIRGSLPFAIAIIGGFLLAYLIVAFLIFPSGVIPRDIRVPNVTGLSFDDAVRRLAERGLQGVRGEERFHAASPKGTVLDQHPTAGSRDVEGAQIMLATSAGQQTARVPAVIGKTREDAQLALEEAGFDVGDVSERPSQTPAGQVVDSRPRGGSDATIPGAIALVISAGPTPVVIPNVIRQPVSQARLILEAAGVTVSEVKTPTGADVKDESAVVTGSTPGPGTQVEAGSKVALQATPRPPR